MEEYDIFIRGFAGPQAAAAESGLSRMFGLDARRAREFVLSLPRVVKRNVPADHAPHYERALRELGAEYELRRSPIRPVQIIAVAGGLAPGEPDPEQHGSTLTLTLVPAPSPQAPQPVAHGTASVSRSGSQFAQTVVDDRPPYGLSVEVAKLDARAPATIAEVSAVALPVQDRSRTWPETPLNQALEPRPAAMPPMVEPRAAVMPAMVPEPRAAATPMYGEEAWASLRAGAAAAPATAGVAAPRARPSEPPPLDAGLPPPWQVPGLALGAQPDWLLQSREMYENAGPALNAPAGSAPTVGSPISAARGQRSPHAGWQSPFPASGAAPSGAPPPFGSVAPGAQELALDECAVPQPTAPRNQARAPRAPAGPISAAPLGTHTRPPPAVGLHVGRELPVDEPSPLLRVALRAGLGISLFVVLTTVRHCRVFDGGVDDALAQWGEQPSAELAADGSEAPPPQGGYGPPALEWMESDLHQFTSGDKDRARSIARRYKKAGALEVYVGTIMQSGPVQYAGELIVELPRNEAARKAVLAEHQRVLEGSFGGFAPEVSDPGGRVLRVTL